MASMHDLVAAIRQGDGVEAAVILGRDGLVIDSQTIEGLDAEELSARIPPIFAAGDDVGAATGRGELMTAVLEHTGGLALISGLTRDVVLLVLLAPRANVGQILYELRRYRGQIAALV
jgi:uncharacterized protein